MIAYFFQDAVSINLSPTRTHIDKGSIGFKPIGSTDGSNEFDYTVLTEKIRSNPGKINCCHSPRKLRKSMLRQRRWISTIPDGPTNVSLLFPFASASFENAFQQGLFPRKETGG